MSFDISKANISWASTKGKKSGRGGYGSFANNYIRVTVQKNGKNPDGSKRTCNCLSIGSVPMERSRMMHGDQVKVGVAEQNGKKWLVVSRVTDGTGYTLGGTKGSKTGFSKFAYQASESGTLPFPAGADTDINTMVVFPNGVPVEIVDEQ